METICGQSAYFIQKQPYFSEGKRYLLTSISELFPEYDANSIEELELISLQNELHRWILKVLKNKPHSKNIKSIWFV